MSRCYPYPPPGYSRDGATYESLIESIKLQKETEKAKAKAERKKEKKKEKKDKDQRKDREKGKANSLTDAQEGTKSWAEFKDALDKRREPSAEHLERSDLTEEHGQPANSHKPSYSSDSTQNSNKRKRDDASNPGDIIGHGKKIIKIRLKKHKGPESSNDANCSTSGRTDQLNTCDADARTQTLHPSTSGRVDISAPSTSSFMQVQGLDGRDRATGLPGYGRSWFSGPPANKNGALQGHHFVERQSMPKQNSAVEGVDFIERQSMPKQNRAVQSRHLIGQQSIPSFEKVVLPASQVRDERLGSNSSRTVASAPSGSNTAAKGVQLGVERSSSEIPIQHISNVPTAPSNVPMVPITRFGRKMQKQHKKYEKLIGSWVLPDVQALQAQLADDSDDQDWLFRKKDLSGREEEKTCTKPSDDVEMTCHQSASSLWRPLAQYLPEADVYALPFTVPF